MTHLTESLSISRSRPLVAICCISTTTCSSMHLENFFSVFVFATVCLLSWFLTVGWFNLLTFSLNARLPNVDPLVVQIWLSSCWSNSKEIRSTTTTLLVFCHFSVNTNKMHRKNIIIHRLINAGLQSEPFYSHFVVDVSAQVWICMMPLPLVCLSCLPVLLCWIYTETNVRWDDTYIWRL